MRTILLFALFSPFLLAQPQQKIAPDCSVKLGPASATGVSSNWDNRPNSPNQGQPCTQWILIASATTATASFSVRMETAQDNNTAGCAGCSYTLFGTALTAEGSTLNSGYGDYIRINLTAISGGTVQATLNGWRDNADSIAGSVVGPGCTPVGGDLAVLFNHPAGTCDGSSSFTFNPTGSVMTIAGPIVNGSVVFASLPTPSNGMQIYCSDCTVTSSIDNTCAGSGGGAFAHRVNGAWKCSL